MYCSSKRHDVHINMTNIFWGEKCFLKRSKQWQSLICLKNCEMNNFLAIKEFCAKFTGINFLGRTNVKYLMQTQLLRFCKNTAKVSSLPLLKITTKSTHFLPAKKKTQKQPSRGVLRKRCSENEILNEIFMIASSARRLWNVYAFLLCLWQGIMIPKQL